MRKNYGTWYTLPLAVWISLFFVIPIAIVLIYSVLTRDYTGGVIWKFSLDSFAALANPSFLKATATTIFIALVSTAITIVLAMPVAYYMARSRSNTILLLLVVVPFWVNFLIRVYAWMAVLGQEGFLNDLIRWMGLTNEPVTFLFNIWAVIIVHVYAYLPYAILPLFTTIEKFDFGLLEAARDLGASHLKSLTRIMLPNVQSGIITAVLFTFIPILGSYAIPDLIGGTDSTMLGTIVALNLRTGNNWPLASSISVVLTVITSIGLLLYFLYNQRLEKVHLQFQEETK
jgi:spermidine/putrescine transport system permease protein